MATADATRSVKVGPVWVPVRFIALVTFCLMALSNGFAWFEFDPIVPKLKAHFPGAATDSTASLLSSWQPIVFISLFVPMTIVITQHNGLRRSLRFGSSVALVGVVLKVVGIFSSHGVAGVALLHTGQILVAFGAPGIIGGVSSIAAQFFPMHERTRATAAAILCNDMGGAVGYLLIPELERASLGLGTVVLFELALTATICFLMWTVFPEAPRRRALVAEEDTAAEHHHIEADGDTEDLPLATDAGPAPGGFLSNFSSSTFSAHISFKAQVKSLVSKRSNVLILVMYAWCSGGFVAWTSMFDVMLDKFYDDTVIGTISFAASASYVCGGLLAGVLVDKFFHSDMAAFISTCLGIASICGLGFTAVIPNAAGHSALEVSAPLTAIYAGAVTVGFFVGGATPIFFELLAAMTFPIDEGVSGGLLSISEAVGALLLYQVLARVFEGSRMNYAFTFGLAGCLLISSFVVERHNRPDAEDTDMTAVEQTEKPAAGAPLRRRAASRAESSVELSDR